MRAKCAAGEHQLACEGKINYIQTCTILSQHESIRRESYMQNVWKWHFDVGSFCKVLAAANANQSSLARGLQLQFGL